MEFIKRRKSRTEYREGINVILIYFVSLNYSHVSKNIPNTG